MDAYQTDQQGDGRRSVEAGPLGFLIDSERIAFVVAALLLVASGFFRDWSITTGVAVGAVVSLFNMRVLVFLARKLERGNVSRQTLWISVFLIKFALLLLAIFLILRYMQLAPLAFLCGISVTPVAIFIGSQRLMDRERS
ncbi:MAG: ATP synthase subunit I [Myxococcales bacterium]|nr:ATP synthase subunit I [Myxococcales bacterium]